MLDVKQLSYLDNAIKSAYGRYIYEALKEYCIEFNKSLLSNETVLENFRNAAEDFIMTWYYATGCSINTNYQRYNPNDYVPAELRAERDKHVEKLVAHHSKVRDMYLDLLYSRPSDEEIDTIYFYVNNSHKEIECAK